MEDTGRSETGADIYARRVGQLTYLFDEVLEERRMIPAGTDWRISGFKEVWAKKGEEYDSEERNFWSTFSGLWEGATETIYLNAANGGVSLFPDRDAASHELMHAYDWKVLGVNSWHWAHRIEADGYHFALGGLGSEIHREVQKRRRFVAWTCGDGGETPPAKYGCDEPGWWGNDGETQ